VSSLIGLSPSDGSRQRSGSCSPPQPLPPPGGPRLAPTALHPSPNVSVGPPAPPPPPPGAGPGLYPFLLHPGLYQHLVTGMNPMLLNAQLQALAASSANPMLGAYGQFHPGLLQVHQAAATAERLRAAVAASTAVTSASSHRYSPYPLPSPPQQQQQQQQPQTTSMSLSSPSSVSSPSMGGSAFHSVRKLTEVSPKFDGAPSSDAEAGGRRSAEKASSSPGPVTSIPQPTASSEEKMEEDSDAKTLAATASDIKSMEKLVNGLNGSSASKFGISHSNDQREISA
jgi:hypothetical protein